MKTCNTCKSWCSNPDARISLPETVGECLNNKITECDANSELYRKNDKKDMLIYEFYEGGMFYTGKDFGCVHHEEHTKNE